MKKFISIISVLAIAASLTACNDIETSESNSGNFTSSENSVTTQSTAVSERSSSSDTSSGLSDNDYSDLKGEELIAKFEWPYDDPIDLSGLTAKAEKTPGTTEDIPLSEISDDFWWHITCDYGYLAMTPETGDEFEYKRYEAGDKIGDFTVSQISTIFDNMNCEYLRYFAGARADFEGEATLTGELAIAAEDPASPAEIMFYPDEESRRKLPMVNFMPKLNITYHEYYSYNNLTIGLGNRADYPDIEFENIPSDGTRVKVRVRIKDYGYSALFRLPFLGSADIADGDLEIL